MQTVDTFKYSMLLKTIFGAKSRSEFWFQSLITYRQAMICKGRGL